MIKTRESGIKEGISRSLSQSLVYGIERRKTQVQLFGSFQKMSLQNWVLGCGTSSFTAGLVFTTYFSIYNNIIKHENAFISNMAGTIAGFITSFIKIPIGNSMRLLQTGKVDNVLSAGQLLFKKHGLPGLYKGYRISLIEDIIEMDVRLRVYNSMTKKFNKDNNLQLNTLIGCLSGAVASAVTTPFDTVRSRMIYNRTGILNINGLYSGIEYRSLSNAVKSGAFFLFYEIIKKM